MFLRTLKLTFAIVISLAFAQLAFAQEVRPIVESLGVEAGGSVLRIDGRHLARMPRLVLNGQSDPLVLLSASDHEIRAALPPMECGSYSLRVIHGTYEQELSLEIGPIGPALDEKR